MISKRQPMHNALAGDDDRLPAAGLAEKKEGIIERELKILEANVEKRLLQKLAILDTRLAPVLSPTEAAPGEEKSESPSVSSLASRLQNLGGDICVAISEIDDILNRLQL